MPVTNPPPRMSTLFQRYGTDLTLERLAEPEDAPDAADGSPAPGGGGVRHALATSATSTGPGTNFREASEEKEGVMMLVSMCWSELDRRRAQSRAPRPGGRRDE